MITRIGMLDFCPTSHRVLTGMTIVQLAEYVRGKLENNKNVPTIVVKEQVTGT